MLSKKRLTKNFFVVAASIAVALFIFELIGHFAIQYIETKRPSGVFGEEVLSHKEPLLGFALKKNLDLSLPGWDVKTNTLSFRSSEELEPKKPEGEVRIFLVGGSTVFGWGVPQTHTISHFLNDLVKNQKKHASVRVINAGVPWYASWHESAFIFFRILALEPDAIIILDGLNDTANAILPTWTPLHLGFMDVPTRIAYDKRYASADVSSFLTEVLKMSPTLRYILAKMNDRKNLNKGVYHPEVWNQYSNYMDWLSRLTKSLDIHFAVFFQPVIAVHRTLLPREEKNNATSLRIPEFASMFRKLYLEGEKRLLQQKTFRFTSLSRLFENEEEFIYIDGLHYSVKANQLLAKAIYEKELRPLLD